MGPLFWHVRQAPNSQEQDDAAVELACLLDEEGGGEGSQPLSPPSHSKVRSWLGLLVDPLPTGCGLLQRLLTTIVGTRPSPHKQPSPGRVSPGEPKPVQGCCIYDGDFV